jgi:hypothetical protein
VASHKAAPKVKAATSKPKLKVAAR